MKLKDIIQGLETTGILGSASVEINGVHIDSRKVTKGDLFIAMRGTQSDGHAFIPKAIEAGASAIVCEEIPAELEGKDLETTFICVPNTEMIEIGRCNRHQWKNHYCHLTISDVPPDGT